MSDGNKKDTDATKKPRKRLTLNKDALQRLDDIKSTQVQGGMRKSFSMYPGYGSCDVCPA